jgi:hypothetical protein
MKLDTTLAVVLGFLIAASVNAMGQEQVLHAFNGRDGVHPVGSVILGAAGNLYGGTNMGGDLACHVLGSDGCGVVFEIRP